MTVAILDGAKFQQIEAVGTKTMNDATRQIFESRNANFEQAVRSSFDAQGIMHLLGATMPTIEPGFCVIELPFSPNLTQQDGFFHAGATSTIADSAGGYAALSLMPAGARVLTVEFKINLLAPARGDRLRAEAAVIKSGKNLTVATININAIFADQITLCAVMQQTTICLTDQL